MTLNLKLYMPWCVKYNNDNCLVCDKLILSMKKWGLVLMFREVGVHIFRRMYCLLLLNTSTLFEPSRPNLNSSSVILRTDTSSLRRDISSCCVIRNYFFLSFKSVTT